MKQGNQTTQPKRTNPYWGLLAGILIVLFINGLLVPTLTGRQIRPSDYGTFIAKVDSGRVSNVVIKDGKFILRRRKTDRLLSIRPEPSMTRNWWTAC